MTPPTGTQEPKIDLGTDAEVEEMTDEEISTAMACWLLETDGGGRIIRGFKTLLARNANLKSELRALQEATARKEPVALLDPNPFRGDGLPNDMPHHQARESVCQVCKQPVRASTGMGEYDKSEAWHWRNVAPDAASGGTLLPIHERCAAPPGSEVRKDEDGERLEDFSDQIDSWANAYPLDCFPEIDDDLIWMRIADLLEENGLPSLDRISASNMRHVITKVKEMKDAAIDAARGKQK